MAQDIIIRPIISEKADKLSSKSSKYTFAVAKSANKIEIAKAFSAMFPEVTVLDVNTMIMPGKMKSRNTRSGVLKGRKSPVKKAVITLNPGEQLEIFNAEA